MTVGLVGLSAPMEDHEVPMPAMLPQHYHCHDLNSLCSTVPSCHWGTAQTLSEPAKPKGQKGISKLVPFGPHCWKGLNLFLRDEPKGLGMAADFPLI